MTVHGLEAETLKIFLVSSLQDNILNKDRQRSMHWRSLLLLLYYVERNSVIIISDPNFYISKNFQDDHISFRIDQDTRLT